MLTPADEALIQEARARVKALARGSSPYATNLSTMIDLCEIYLDSGALTSQHVGTLLSLEDTP